MTAAMTTGLLIATSIVLFAAALHAAVHLLGTQTALRSAGFAVVVGWLAEQLGTSFGWLFGSYRYTDVLGPKLLDVPAVIPLMWFALPMIGWAMAQMLLWGRVSGQRDRWPQSLLIALMAAMLVTAFDLGADPYFVYILKAWVMEKPHGGWFGETVEGFAGWMATSFLITLFIERSRSPAMPALCHARAGAAVGILLSLYLAAMLFQMAWGANLALKVISFFVMGIPLLASWTAWHRWLRSERAAAP